MKILDKKRVLVGIALVLLALSFDYVSRLIYGLIFGGGLP